MCHLGVISVVVAAYENRRRCGWTQAIQSTIQQIENARAAKLHLADYADYSWRRTPASYDAAALAAAASKKIRPWVPAACSGCAALCVISIDMSRR